MFPKQIIHVHQMYSSVNMTQVVTVMIISTTIIFSMLQFAHSVENDSYNDFELKTDYVIGRFFHSEPSKDDKFFVIHHNVINGSLIEVKQNVRDAGIKFNITSTDNGSLYVEIPRNYPYSNQPWFDPFVIINGEEMRKDVDYILEKGECFYKFTTSFSGNSIIEIAFAHIPEHIPFISEQVSADCTERTIAPDPPTLDFSYLSPLDQFKSGKKISEIQCKFNLRLIEKINGTPACVTPETKIKLIERGWALS